MSSAARHTARIILAGYEAVLVLNSVDIFRHEPNSTIAYSAVTKTNNDRSLQ